MNEKDVGDVGEMGSLIVTNKLKSKEK